MTPKIEINGTTIFVIEHTVQTRVFIFTRGILCGVRSFRKVFDFEIIQDNFLLFRKNSELSVHLSARNG